MYVHHFQVFVYVCLCVCALYLFDIYNLKQLRLVKTIWEEVRGYALRSNVQILIKYNENNSEYERDLSHIERE